MTPMQEYKDALSFLDLIQKHGSLIAKYATIDYEKVELAQQIVFGGKSK